MKKNIIGIMWLWLLTLSMPVYAADVSLKEAENAAINWLSERTAKGAGTFTVFQIFTEMEKGYRAYYVFNFKPGGWVVVCADDVASPVIAYSPTGLYSRKNHPPGFDEWMGRVKKMIVSAIESQMPGSPETSNEWTRLKVDPKAFRKSIKAQAVVINPLVQTTWNQNFPYNEQTPADPLSSDGHALTGCVATAMAQVMRYHAYPSTGWGSHSYDHDTYGTLSADFGATTYNWAAMPNTASVSNSEIARLNYHCGVSVEMDYGPDYSSGSIIQAMAALKNYFKYEESLYYVNKNNYTDEQWKSLIKADLNAQRPILYSGPGHAFICDGYDDVDFFHFNWGWGGLFDGYYALDDLTPGSSNYTNGQTAVIRIQKPTQPDLALPYFQGFETGMPDEWIFSGERVSLSTADKHSGAASILLNDPAISGENTNIAALKINVPDNGAVLEFWVKRGNDAATVFNKQIIQIKTQFGSDVLLEIFTGNVNDAEWQKFTVNLTPWENSVVTLYFEEATATTIPASRQWMYIDDVEIIANEVPVSDFKADVTRTCTGTIHFTDLSSFFPTSWSWSFPGGNPSSSTEQNPAIAYSASGTYTVSLTGSNGIGQGSTQTKTAYLHIYDAPQVQCVPATLDLSEPGFHFGVYNVTFNTINQTTSGSVDDNGYQDFSCVQITDLQTDTDYPVSVTVGPIGHPVNAEYVKIFIDYNNDGDFNDSGELALSSPKNAGVHSGTIHTPVNPLMDALLRMRVMSDFYSIANACADLTYGQAEDYGIVFRSTIAPCDFTITPDAKTCSADGGAGSVEVEASDDSCEWAAVSNAAWITVTGGASGTGDGTVIYSVSANTGCTQRTGTITIAGEFFTVTQDAGACTFNINPESKTYAATGGTDSVAVDAALDCCDWSTTSNSAWIAVTGGASGTGDGAVDYSVAANTGAARTGTITIAGETFTVTQNAGFNLDIDNNGAVTPFTDGILILRYLLDYQQDGPTWINAAVGANAQRSTAAEIEAYLGQGLALLDIDNNGSVTPFTDGILILRYLLDYQQDGPTWINGAVGANAQRTSAADIEAYIDSLIP